MSGRRRRSALATTTVLASAFTLSACSLLTNFDELYGGPGDGGAGASSASGGPVGKEAGVEPPVGTNGSDGGDGSVASFCAGATFCDDFERTQPQGAWPDYNLEGGSSFAITNDAPHSGKGAIRLTPGKSAGAAAMLIYRPPPLKHIEVVFAFRITAAIKHSNFFALSFADGPKERDLFFVFNDAQISYAEQLIVDGDHKDYFESDKIDVPLGRWSEAAVSFDIETRSLRVVFNGTTVIDDYTVKELPSDAPLVFAGIPYVDPGPAYDIDLDDVRLTLVPK